MKLCINCVHHLVDEMHMCTKHAMREISPVTGKTSVQGICFCEIERKTNPANPNSTRCGPDGKHFEQKPEEFKPVKVSFWKSFSMV